MPTTSPVRVALVTCRDLAELTESDQVLAAALRARGIAADPAIWNDAETDWRRYDLVVIRSPWDYFHHIGEFIGWIDRLEAAGVPLANDPAVLRWNSHKRYLRELADRGAPVTPSLWLDMGSAGAGRDLDALVAERGWQRVVIKPAVSGGAHETWVTTAPLDAAARTRVSAMRTRGDVLVQPFIDAVTRDGEVSFLFVEGRFTHAVRKRAAAGDFRVQIEHGGSFDREPVTAGQVDAAARVLAMAPAPTLYGRVDAVVSQTEFLLMELEVLEPDLFFTTAPEAAELLAVAIERRIADRPLFCFDGQPATLFDDFAFEVLVRSASLPLFIRYG